MRTKIALLMLAVVILLAACGTIPEDAAQTTTVKVGVTGFERFIDEEAAVVCWYKIETTYYGKGIGISCLPLADTNLY